MRLEQRGLAVRVAATGVVAGGDQVGAQHQRVLEEGLELDLPVAEDVGVGRAPRPVLLEEVLEHVVPVLGGEVGAVQLDAESVGHRLGIGQVFLRRAVLGAVVLFPVLHEQAFHGVALLLEEQRGDGGVDTAGHADDDFLSPSSQSSFHSSK